MIPNIKVNERYELEFELYLISQNITAQNIMNTIQTNTINKEMYKYNNKINYNNLKQISLNINKGIKQS